MSARLDAALADVPAEYPITVTTWSRNGTPIVTTVYPHHEARVLRAKAVA